MKEVKTPKKPLIYYYMIVIIALLLFNFLAVPFITEREIKDAARGVVLWRISEFEYHIVAHSLCTFRRDGQMTNIGFVRFQDKSSCSFFP